MSKIEKACSERHQQIKVLAEGALANNVNVHMSHIVPQEFAEVAQYYPIFLCKDSDTGQFQPVALFGLDVDENIYQASGLWEKCYLPLKIQCQPFYLIADPEQEESSRYSKPCLSIDMDDSRVQLHQGEALFIDGKASPYLQLQANILTEFSQGFILNRGFVNALVTYDLLESVELDIKYNNGQENRLKGLYTINKEMLEKVPADIQKEFEQQGYVGLMSAMLSSVTHVSTLVGIKNDLLG